MRVRSAIEGQRPRFHRAALLGGFRWVMGALSLAAALAGEALAEEARTRGEIAPPQLSWVLFGVAGLLFAMAMWPVPRLQAAVASSFLAALRSMARVRLIVFFVSLGLALVCALASLPLFLVLNGASEGDRMQWLPNNGSWILWIASLLLFGLAWVVWERSAPPEGEETPQPGDRLPREIEWGLMALLFVVAWALRVPGLEGAPPGLWFDEAQNGLVAGRITAPDAYHPTFIAEQTQMGALYFYFQGIILKVFGASVWQLRIMPALAGALIAPLLYLLGSRLFGWRVGLAAGGLVAVSAWNITFSRIGFVSLTTVALNLAVYVCLVQALRTGRLGYFAGGGVLLGLALQGYYVSRLVPLVLLAVLVHRLVSEQIRLVRALRTGVVVFALGALIAFLPVGLFALQNGPVYNARIDEVSIFAGGGGGDPLALQRSLERHILMFNFKGDANGRHNLPLAPMLDWLSAALFFAGLASCVLRAWRWQYFFPLVWLAAAMSGGVLSILFEAPQSHRALEASVVTALIGGIFLGELWHLLTRASHTVAERAGVVAPEGSVFRVPWRRARRARASEGAREAARTDVSRRPAQPAVPSTLPVRAPVSVPTKLPVRKHSAGTGAAPAPVAATPLPMRAARARGEESSAAPPAIEEAPTRTRPAATRFPLSRRQTAALVTGALGIVATLVWVGAVNAQRYFDVQLKNRTVWREMYVPETEAARVLLRYRDTHDVYITPVFAALPPSQYLAAGVSPTSWPGMHAVPLSPTAGRDVVILLDPPSAADLAMLARLYPNATFEPLQSPGNPMPLAWTITIPAGDINSLQGVRATVLGENGEEVVDTALPTPQFDRQAQGVTSGTLRLSATLRVPSFDEYRFEWQAAGGEGAQGAGLMVDGYEVTAGVPISLAAGLHSIVATNTLTTGSGISQLLWTSRYSGLPLHLIEGTELFDPRKVEPRGLTGFYRPGTDIGATPTQALIDPVISAYFHNTVLPRPYMVEWKGQLYIPQEGLYTFGTEQLSTSRLFIDDRELIANLSVNSLLENTLPLTAGLHDIRLVFEDRENYSHMYLYWTPPGRSRAIIPSAFLWPLMGSYPERPESGAFPTLSEFDGTLVPPERLVGAALPPVVNPVQPPPGAPPRDPEPAGPPQLRGEAITPLYELGQGKAFLQGPFSVAGDEAGNSYVFTVRDGLIHKFDAEGAQVAEWRALKADSAQPLTEVSSMAVQGGELLALDAETSQLIVYTLDGELVTRNTLCACFSPRGLSIARDGNLWVSDTGNSVVLKVTREGRMLATLGARGSDPGQFVEPVATWEAPDGTLFVADVGNSRVQSFTAEGRPRAQWPMGPSVARDGNRLTGDEEGRVLVTQSESRSIARYDADGKESGRWSYARGSEVLVPAGIAPVGEGRLVVLFLQNNAGLVFEPGP